MSLPILKKFLITKETVFRQFFSSVVLVVVFTVRHIPANDYGSM